MRADLRVLRTLVAVVDCGTVIGASRARGYSAAAVSRQMSALQSRLGVRLFVPDGRSIAPTAEAVELAERAREVTAAADAFETYTRSIAGAGSARATATQFRPAGSVSLTDELQTGLLSRLD